MLVFHEGLPRSGKTFEAVARQIIPALADGRKVFARINGLNHEKIAECAGITVERCRELLHELTDEQTREIWQHVEDNALVVVDEIHEFWPNSRARNSPGNQPEVLKFFAMHGHHGMDIIGMGQVLGDVHTCFRRRVDRKIQFETRDVVGRPTDYTWRAFKLRDPAKEKYELVQTGKGTYDEKFFGTYKTRVADTTRADRLADTRINIWTRPAIKFGVPLVAILFGLGVFGGFWFFKGGGGLTSGLQAKAEAEKAANSAAPGEPAPKGAPASVAPKQARQAPVPVHEPAKLLGKFLDPLDVALQSGRPRLVGVIRQGDYKVDGLIEVWSKDDSLLERWRIRDAVELGWAVTLYGWGMTLEKGDARYALQSWPRDYSGGQRGVESSSSFPASGESRSQGTPSGDGSPSIDQRVVGIRNGGTYGGVPAARS